MSRKPSGLAAFTTSARRPAGEGTAAAAPLEASAPEGGKRRGRGQGETVALTVRIARSDWTRLHALAMSEASSLQALAVQGFSEILTKHGLPPMETP